MYVHTSKILKEFGLAIVTANGMRTYAVCQSKKLINKPQKVSVHAYKLN